MRSLQRLVYGGAKIELGGFLLNCVSRYSKLIALAAAIFLISAKLDNVPDCPELLNSSSGTAASLQLVHHNVAVHFDTTYVAWEIFRSPAITTQSALDVLLVTLPAWVPQSLYRAADLSPPAA